MLRHPRRRPFSLAAALVAAAAVASCGIKGPLQPPPKDASAQKPAAPAPDPSAPAERKP